MTTNPLAFCHFQTLSLSLYSRYSWSHFCKDIQPFSPLKQGFGKFALYPESAALDSLLKMESLNYYLEARGPVFSENVEFSLDHLLSRNKNLGKDWDAKVLSDFVKYVPGSDRETVRSMEFVETKLPNTMAESLLANAGLGASSDKITDITSDTIPSASVVNFDPLMSEGFALNVSVTAHKPHSQKDSTVDTNLEKWTDSGEANYMPNSEENIVSSDSSLKRARTANLHSQIPLCQVHGCYKDLSSSKDYHKRHRVCDVHSKTAKVIINGIEKRFCQQCSRFHLLTDFDDGKRSCRKRLAGHNERRRKPQLGPGFLDMALLKGTSFLSPEAAPAGFFYQENFEKDNQSRQIKFVEGIIDSSQLAVPEKNVQSPHIYLADQHIIKRPRPSGECIDTAAIAVELSAVRGSSSALSLLSAQSQNTSSNSADMSMALPRCTNGVNQHAYIRTDQNSAENLATSTLEGFSVNDYSFGTINQEGIQRFHDGCMAVSFKGKREGTFQESKYRHANRRPFPDVGTLDLLQLSSHLQRVEQQRNSLQVKHENETFCCSSAV